MERNTSTIISEISNIPIHQEIQVLSADSPKSKIGFVIEEEVGLAFYNPVVAMEIWPIPQGVVTIKDERIIRIGFFPQNLYLSES